MDGLCEKMILVWFVDDFGGASAPFLRCVVVFSHDLK